MNDEKKLKSNTEVYSKRIAGYEPEKFQDKYCLIKSDLGRVTYKVISTQTNIFNYPNYKKFFKMLKQIEAELDSDLPFYVSIDYITIEAFKEYIQSHGYEKLKAIIDTKIFELLTDITLQTNIFNIEEIAKRYITDKDLINFHEYYALNSNLVLYNFEKQYSSLYLYEAIYKEKSPNEILANIYNLINDSKSSIRQDFAKNLIISFKNELSSIESEKKREDLFYYIVCINKNIDKFNENKIKSIKNYSIQEIYN